MLKREMLLDRELIQRQATMFHKLVLEIIGQLIMTSKINPVIQKPYWTLENLKEIYLEDSWVLDIIKTDDAIVFLMNIVLCEEHYLYQPRKPNEQYYYRNGRLIFKNVSKFIKFIRSDIEAIDADGIIDYGNIDTFVIVSDNSYSLVGDWGELKLVSDQPIIIFDAESTT